MSAAAFLGAVQDRVPVGALNRLGDSIEETERFLRLEMGSLVETVANCGNQTLLAGGKRLRPALTIASAGAAGDIDATGLCGVSAGVELIHMATLIHDDVIDGAATRRGVPTASAVYGNTQAILSGDVLLAKAMRLLAEHSDIEMIRLVSQGVVELAEGEVLELECRGRLDLTAPEYLRVLDLKTATFISCCCRAGARLAGADATMERAVGDYGRHLGIAFQLVDDVLDYRGSQLKTGKPLATDFIDGQATWPLIKLIEQVGDDEKERIAARFGQPLEDSETAWLITQMEEHGTLDMTLDKARFHAEKSIAALGTLPASDYKTILETVALFIVEREV